MRFAPQHVTANCQAANVQRPAKIGRTMSEPHDPSVNDPLRQTTGPVEEDVGIVEAKSDPPLLADVVELRVIPAARDISAMADPENAHSPMSPDHHVSNQHTGLHIDEHSTGGTTPAS